MVQKLTAEELEEQAKREKAANAKGVSVWNQVHLCHAVTFCPGYEVLWVCSLGNLKMAERYCIHVFCSVPIGREQLNDKSWSSQAGTFEERDCTAYAKEELKRLMDNFQHESAAGCLQISELTSVEGEATVWLVRGSRRWALEIGLATHAHAFSVLPVLCDAKGTLSDCPGVNMIA